MAQGLGADVTILEVDLERMRFLDITLHTAHTLYSNESHLLELLPNVDLLIGRCCCPAPARRNSFAATCSVVCGRAVCLWILRLTKAAARKRHTRPRITTPYSSRKA